MIWVFFFFGCVSLLFFLPLLPALYEWRKKNDDQPLKVVREYDGNIQYFAVRFRHFLNVNFPDFGQGVGSDSEPMKGHLPGGDAYQIVRHDGKPVFAPKEIDAKASSEVILARAPLQISTQMFFEKEVYAGGGISGGNKISFRAILADGNIHLGDHCDIIRWAHSNDSILLGESARLYGRISAENEIQLRQNTRFGRMNAPVIRFGLARKMKHTSESVLQRLHTLAIPDKIIDQALGRWLVGESLTVPTGSFHRGSLVARKNLTVQSHSVIIGGIKSTGNVRLEGKLRIDGAVVAAGNIYIGSDCIIKGPIVSEKMIFIETGTVIGSPNCPTTVTAVEMRIEEGVLAHGSVWAREIGFVSSRRKESA